MTRIFFTTDVHGSDRCFRKFLNAAKVYKADCLILGGDITGKVLIPIIEGSDGKYEAQIFGERSTFGKEKLEEARKRLQDAGQYSFVTTGAELAEIQADKAREERIFNDAMAQVLNSWVQLAQERLKGSGVRCYVSPGNDDKLEIDAALADSGELINPEGRVVELDGGFEMITLGTANPTPWKSPREVSEERLGEMIERLASQVNRPEDAVYNLHVPPINTELDRAPAVSHDFNYVREGLGVKYIHAGSSAVRKAIERHSPLLGLHGHIHESKGFARIGRTLCLNPGSEYADGILRGALANLEPGKVHDFMLTSG
ncbi:MAG: metallophosphoesterase [Nitrososphaerota archaeon]|nr:metallophosphoesterase [Nitrososphaerota archaeon]MDG6941833.1 metallophosphoesterase [Nitrososphaerota archaeon]MDG6946994.1 metallophosphoesterase [Nitrososphaerota archaeon]